MQLDYGWWAVLKNLEQRGEQSDLDSELSTFAQSRLIKD